LGASKKPDVPKLWLKLIWNEVPLLYLAQLFYEEYISIYCMVMVSLQKICVHRWLYLFIFIIIIFYCYECLFLLVFTPVVKRLLLLVLYSFTVSFNLASSTIQFFSFLALQRLRSYLKHDILQRRNEYIVLGPILSMFLAHVYVTYCNIL
jgi:hypothetical protein